MIIRKTALAFLFAAGVASIMATSPPPREDHFKTVEVRPSYRCPGDPVEIAWQLSRPAPVTVLIGEEPLFRTEAGRITLAADDLDRRQAVASLTLRIEAEDPEWPYERSITTLGRPYGVEGLAFHRRRGEFLMRDRDSWNPRIRVVALSLKQIRDLSCADGRVVPPAWTIVPPAGAPFQVKEEADFATQLDTGLPAAGDWLFRIEGGDCRLPKDAMEPYLEVRLTAVCPKD